MSKKQRETVKELLFWSYANLAMAHSALDKKQSKYGTFNFVIRAKLYKGLMTDTMNVRTIFDDEKVKLKAGQKCSYCDETQNLTLDHVFPQKLGGKDVGDNLIYACRRCNSSKGRKDLMEWMHFNGEFLPLMIIRRYLKLTVGYCIEHGLMDKKIDELTAFNLPFKIEFIPQAYPSPDVLKLL